MNRRMFFQDTPPGGGGRKSQITVTHGKTSGSVVLKAAPDLADGRCIHEWQMSKDGITWQSLPPTVLAQTVVTGLTPGERVYFRHRRVNKEGNGSWSN